MAAPVIHDDAAKLADCIIDRLGGHIVLGLPLGLGKANRIANALYHRAAGDPAISLHIITALTLEPPAGTSDMEKRFMEPFAERLYGGYERLAYAEALRDGTLPDNIRVSEFFLMAGRWLGVPAVQQDYISANYTHAGQMLLDKGVNVLAQLVSRQEIDGQTRYSLACNSDITLDILPSLRKPGRPFLFTAEVSAELPFMGGEANLPADEFDHVLHTPEQEPSLFVVPKQPVSAADHAIGIHAASLVKDGGTIQIGIGSLGDAFVAALIMRHRAPDLFCQTLTALNGGTLPAGRETEPFEVGLYAATEMFVDGFMPLYQAGILKRKAADGAVLHAGFFLGTKGFYRFLRDLPAVERDLFAMRGISFVNELYGGEADKCRDRADARFVNSAMMVTLLGETVSDTLDDGRVVSGVGGQYNFVSQAFALEGARSIITLNATRQSKGKRQSRILARAPHITIPRHLRDIFITEYGIADLRGKSDRDCIEAMLAITDSAFQDELLEQAQKTGKIGPGYRPSRRNSPDQISRALRPAHDAGHCQAFPFGTDFTAVERELLPALGLLKEKTATKRGAAKTVLAAMTTRQNADDHADALSRMKLHQPDGFKEKIYQSLLLWALYKVKDEDRA